MESGKTGVGQMAGVEIDLQKVFINFCSYDELLSLPSVGEATADRIWDLRKRGDITEESLAQVPHIRMHEISQYIDYTTLDHYMFYDSLQDEFEDKCGLEDETEIETEATVVENKHMLLTPSAFDVKPISHRLACSFDMPYYDNKRSGEISKLYQMWLPWIIWCTRRMKVERKM